MTERSKKIVLGLTGGIACGKSTACKFFNNLGWASISTDQFVEDLMKRDDEVISEIKNRWGSDVLNNSELDKKKIGGIVFSDANEKTWLEKILHPKVRVNWKKWLKESEARLNVIEIPLLFENDLSSHFDFTVCVYSSEKIQMKRLLDRGLTNEESNARIGSQLPITKKSQLADFVVLGEASFIFLERQISSLHASIT